MPHSTNKTSFAVIVSFLCIALVGAIMLPMLTVRLHPLRYNPSITVNFSLLGSSARGGDGSNIEARKIACIEGNDWEKCHFQCDHLNNQM